MREMLARHQAPTGLRSLNAVAAAVLLAVIATGCRNQTAPGTEVPAGFTPMSDDGSGITIAIPADWVRIALPQNLSEFNKTAIEMTGQNPRLGPAINQARIVLQFGGKIMAVSPDGQTRVNVTVDKTKEKNLDEIATHAVPSLEQGGAKDLTKERVTTGAGPALKLRFKFPVEGEGHETLLADEVQYYVLHGGKSYVLTVINGQGDLPDTIARTLRLR